MLPLYTLGSSAFMPTRDKGVFIVDRFLCLFPSFSNKPFILIDKRILVKYFGLYHGRSVVRAKTFLLPFSLVMDMALLKGSRGCWQPVIGKWEQFTKCNIERDAKDGRLV
jgi:hypothetical protein